MTTHMPKMQIKLILVEAIRFHSLFKKYCQLVINTTAMNSEKFQCCWILSLFCDALRLIKVIEDRQALAFNLFVVSSCIVFVASGYAVLYVETRRHRKLIKIQQMPQEEAERFRNENKELKTTVYVVCALMLCFLPMALRLVIHLMKRPEIISSLWVRTFAMLNSLLNPLIYCCRQEEIRNFVFKTRTQAVQPH